MTNSSIISVSSENGYNYFRFEKLVGSSQLNGFDCSIVEYNEYLKRDALRSQKDHIAFTWLLRSLKNNALAIHSKLFLLSK